MEIICIFATKYTNKTKQNTTKQSQNESKIYFKGYIGDAVGGVQQHRCHGATGSTL